MFVKSTFAKDVTVTQKFYSNSDDSQITSYNPTWLITRSGDGAIYVTINNEHEYFENNIGGGNRIIRRTVFGFDTSLIPSSATILSAKLNVYAENKVVNDNDGYDYISVFEYSGNYPITATKSDFVAFGSTKGSNDLDISSSISSSAYNVWNLNAIGLSWINKSGVTFLGMRLGHDIDNHEISGDNYMYGCMTNHSDTSQDPYLEVKYICDILDLPDSGVYTIGPGADYNDDGNVDSADIDDYLKDVGIWVKEVWVNEISF